MALDESGSISNSQVVKFYNELLAIKKNFASDADVNANEPPKDSFTALKAK